MNTILHNDYFRSLAYLAGAFVVAYLIRYILDHYFDRIAARTKTEIDDDFLQIIRGPFNLLVYTWGVYLALHSLALGSANELWITRIAYVATVLIVAVIASRFFSILISKWLKVEKRYEKTPRLITKVVSLVVYVVAALMVLREFNVEITPLIATLGVGGLAVGLALQSTLSNFFSGIFIISDKPINVGDFVELNFNELSGFVEDIGWRTTRIRTLSNTLVVVPNSKLADSIITNNSLPQTEMSVVIQCGVAYGSDLEKVERVTVEVATEIQKRVEGAVPEFEPFIRYHTFGDFNIKFSIILRIKTFVDQYLATHELIKALSARYAQEQIEISWPVRKIVNA